MAGIWEPEEAVGRWWHRWAGAAASYPRFPDARAQLEPLLPSLAVFFRTLGGAGAVRLTAATERRSGHRLTLRQRLGLGEAERLERPSLDGEVLVLPSCVDCFPEPERNRQLYYWLTAFFAYARPPPTCDDPLHADVAHLRAARTATGQVLAHWPGLRAHHDALCAALRAVRPRRALSGWEAAVEEAVAALLGGPRPSGAEGRRILAVVEDPDRSLASLRAPNGYRPFLPVPLWGEVQDREGRAAADAEGAQEAGAAATAADERRRAARRRPADQSERRDSLILNRFETLLALAELLNLNRDVEDDDPESARRAADDLDEIALARHRRRPATRLKLDLELSPTAMDAAPLQGECTYPEWDYRGRRYLPDHCRVVATRAAEEGDDWRPDRAARRRIRAIRRRFEALRPRRQVLHGQPDGEELDLSALVRSVSDRRAGGAGSERIYTQARNVSRDLAVAILVDVSLSTDGWVDDHRVLDVEKESVLALCHGLAACGDDHGVFAFSSHRRRRVEVVTVKEFDEPLRGAPVRRLQALRPGNYTRMGAALRHVSKRLAERPNRHRLLLLLSDGKPNDVDHYEGRYGVEDTRRAIQEARRLGLRPFGITVDRKARDYFPYLFGRGAYAMVPHIQQLPRALAEIYRELTG